MDVVWITEQKLEVPMERDAPIIVHEQDMDVVQIRKHQPGVQLGKVARQNA